MIDQAVNFFNSLVVTAPIPASSGTTMVLAGGDCYYIYSKLGSGLDLVVAPVGTAPSRSNAEIVTVTAIPNTTIASGSNAASLPQSTVNVADCSGFPTSGTCTVVTATGPQTVAYTGKTSTTALTGCTGGTGAMSTGGAIVSDQVTITRASQITAARTILAGDAVTLDFTARSRDQLANAITIQMGVTIPGGKFVNAYKAIVSGDNDVYTVPTGKKAIWHELFTTSTAATYHEIKVSGTYYPMISSGVQGTGNSSTLLVVLNAGESASLNANATNGFAYFSLIEFDATIPIRRYMFTSLTTGDNTIYTCPALSSARIFSSAIQTTNNGQFLYVNNTIGSRTTVMHIVPSGQTPGTGYIMAASSSKGAGTWNSISTFALHMGAGDFINLNIDSGVTQQYGWVNVIEIPN
jgi:hypothetical protein